jgi:hypothetical protein
MEKGKMGKTGTKSVLSLKQGKQSIKELGWPGVASMSRIAKSLHHSPYLSPISDALKSRKPKKQATIGYSNWEYFSAAQQPKKESVAKQVHRLRRNLKNPFIYAGNADIEEEQKKVEIRIMQAVRKIQHFSLE